MALAEAQILEATAPPTEPMAASDAPIELRGRVDAVDEGRIYGWAWNPAEPTGRIEVQVFRDDTQLAIVIADKPRVDLRRNGIGDGGHAFDLELPKDNALPGARLRVVAVHRESGANVELRIPSDAERAAEAAFSTPLGPILDRLESATLAQRRIQSGHTAVLRELTAAARQIADVAGGDSGLADAVKAMRDGQQAIADRFAEMEVVFLRFDSVLAEFHQRLDALSRKSTHGVMPHLLFIAAAVGIITGIALAAGMRL
jgi:hypothetical protein